MTSTCPMLMTSEAEPVRLLDRLDARAEAGRDQAERVALLDDVGLRLGGGARRVARPAASDRPTAAGRGLLGGLPQSAEPSVPAVGRCWAGCNGHGRRRRPAASARGPKALNPPATAVAAAATPTAATPPATSQRRGLHAQRRECAAGAPPGLRLHDQPRPRQVGVGRRARGRRRQRRRAIPGRRRSARIGGVPRPGRTPPGAARSSGSAGSRAWQKWSGSNPSTAVRWSTLRARKGQIRSTA